MNELYKLISEAKEVSDKFKQRKDYYKENEFLSSIHEYLTNYNKLTKKQELYAKAILSKCRKLEASVGTKDVGLGNVRTVEIGNAAILPNGQVVNPPYGPSNKIGSVFNQPMIKTGLSDFEMMKIMQEHSKMLKPDPATSTYSTTASEVAKAGSLRRDELEAMAKAMDKASEAEAKKLMNLVGSKLTGKKADTIMFDDMEWTLPKSTGD